MWLLFVQGLHSMKAIWECIPLLPFNHSVPVSSFLFLTFPFPSLTTGILSHVNLSQNKSPCHKGIVNLWNEGKPLQSVLLVRVRWDFHWPPWMFPTGHGVKDEESEPERKHFFHILVILQFCGGPTEQCTGWDWSPLYVRSYCWPHSHSSYHGNTAYWQLSSWCLVLWVQGWEFSSFCF